MKGSMGPSTGFGDDDPGGGEGGATSAAIPGSLARAFVLLGQAQCGGEDPAGTWQDNGHSTKVGEHGHKVGELTAEATRKLGQPLMRLTLRRWRSPSSADTYCRPHPAGPYCRPCHAGPCYRAYSAGPCCRRPVHAVSSGALLDQICSKDEWSPQ